MRLRLFRKNSRHQQLVDLYRGAEEGSPTPDASLSSHQAFENDQKLIAQLTQLSASAAPNDPSLERGKLLSRVAEMKSAEATMEAPIMRKILQRRTLAAFGAAVVLVAAAATVGAAGGVGHITSSAGDVLGALQITHRIPKVDICHVPDDNSGNAHTISVGEGALEEHVAHGDSEGACADDPSPGSPDGVGPSAQVDICHVPDDNSGNAHTISVGEGALEEHVAHGDSEGACADDPSPGSPDGVGPSAQVDICHVPDDNPDHPRTISVPESALDEHVAHGDSEGACVESSLPDGVELPEQANDHATDGAANADGAELPVQADDRATDGAANADSNENPSLPDAVPDTVDVPLP